MEYYFRVEAVNLYNTIFDTNDISTTRGGSFLLLNAVERLKELDRLEPISIGASAGLLICATLIGSCTALRLNIIMTPRNWTTS